MRGGSRIPDLLDTLRQEYDTIGQEMSVYKAQRDDYERKRSCTHPAHIPEFCTLHTQPRLRPSPRSPPAPQSDGPSCPFPPLTPDTVPFTVAGLRCRAFFSLCTCLVTVLHALNPSRGVCHW